MFALGACCCVGTVVPIPSADWPLYHLKALLLALKHRSNKPFPTTASQVQAIFKIASSQELPAIPDSMSAEASEFVLLCLQRDPTARPAAEDLLKHPFVNSFNTASIPALGGSYRPSSNNR